MEQQYEDEIDLMDYVKVILKMKKLILRVFLATVIVAGVFSFLSPKVYKIDTSLEIGQIAGVMVEDPTQVVEKIDGGIYARLPGIKVSNPKDTDFIKIETTSTKPQQTKKELENLNELILSEHNEKIDAQKYLLEKEIERLQEKIDFLMAEGQEIAILQLEINNLQRQKEALQPTKIIREPTISEKPIRPKLLLNIAIAGVLGIFVGVFFAFGKEWWDKSKA